MQAPVPVTVVTGCLGAGKSTRIEGWLQELPRESTAVIVNERGEVGVDGELLSAHVARVREITGGCVCCSSHAELVAALSELSQTSPRPQRILVETSGAASPAGVIRGIAAPRARQRLQLDGVVTVVDATRLQRALEFDVTVEQLGFADVVVLSHVDEATAEADLAAAQQQAQRYAPTARIIHGRHGVLPLPFQQLLQQRSESLHWVPQGSSHHVIEAVSLSLEGELDEERFGAFMEDVLGAVEARILRLKGILAMQGVQHRVIVQGVSQAVEVQLGSPWGRAERRSRLVVLGLGLDAQALEAGLRSCAAAPDDDRPGPSTKR